MFLIIYKLVPKQRKCLLTFHGMHTRLYEPRGIQNTKQTPEKSTFRSQPTIGH